MARDSYCVPVLCIAYPQGALARVRWRPIRIAYPYWRILYWARWGASPFTFNTVGGAPYCVLCIRTGVLTAPNTVGGDLYCVLRIRTGVLAAPTTVGADSYCVLRIRIGVLG